VPMRLAAALLSLLAAPVSAPAPTPVPTPTPVPGEVVCTVDDPRAIELSGLVATPDGYVSVIDSQFDTDTVRIVYLDRSCAVTRTRGYPTPARDPEDVALDPQGRLWVADIGDNFTAQTRRSTIALWLVPADGDPVIHRMTYPDGPHDAEALLFAGDGTPIVVTKELSGVASLYAPTEPLQPRTAAGVPLAKVGEFRPTRPSPAPSLFDALAGIGATVVTGAATSPDRTRIALRTYTAAYEWDVADGDVVKAITTGTPRVTPLPDETQGESIAYSPDGADFLTVSDNSGPTPLLRYHPTVPPSPTAPAGGAAALVREGLPTVWFAALAAGGGLVLVGAGVLALRRRRVSRP